MLYRTHYKRAPLSSKLRLLCESSQPKLEERNTQMDSVKYIGLDVHRDTISVAVVDQSRAVGHAIGDPRRPLQFWIVHGRLRLEDMPVRQMANGGESRDVVRGVLFLLVAMECCH